MEEGEICFSCDKRWNLFLIFFLIKFREIAKWEKINIGTDLNSTDNIIILLKEFENYGLTRSEIVIKTPPKWENIFRIFEFNIAYD
jgi:hypothetical protein